MHGQGFAVLREFGVSGVDHLAAFGIAGLALVGVGARARNRLIGRFDGFAAAAACRNGVMSGERRAVRCRSLDRDVEIAAGLRDGRFALWEPYRFCTSIWRDSLSTSPQRG